MRATRTALIASAAALALLVSLPAGAQAFSKAIWGQVYRNGVNEFPVYKRLGVKIYETDLEWSSVAPTRPQHPMNPQDPAYRWPANIGQAIAQANRYHIRVLLQIITAPAWANGGHASDWAPTNPATYAAFAAAAAKRYPNVHLWMVWGEPTRLGNFDPIVAATPGATLDRAQQAAPHLYARILNDAYGALKRVSRTNIVIGGCTYTSGLIDPQQWIENLRLPNGRPPRMDMYAQNPFSYETPNFSDPASPFGEVQFSDLPRLESWIREYLHRSRPLFLSEWTIPTQADEEFDFYVSPNVAAQWVTDALRLSRRWKDIYALGWIHVYDSPPYTYGGLLSASGVAKPDFYAFARG